MYTIALISTAAALFGSVSAHGMLDHSSDLPNATQLINHKASSPAYGTTGSLLRVLTLFGGITFRMARRGL